MEHSSLNLFQLFFPPAVVKEICHNTNNHAAIKTPDKRYTWQDVDEEEFYRFLGLVLFTSLVKLPCVEDYWKQNGVTSQPFPGSIMTRNRFRTLITLAMWRWTRRVTGKRVGLSMTSYSAYSLSSTMYVLPVKHHTTQGGSWP